MGLGIGISGPNGSEPCDDANVVNSDGTYDVDVAAGATLTLPDINNVDSDGSVVVTPAQTPFVATACGAGPVGATLNKTNRTVSVRTGDDGDIQAGRATDFLTLASANPFNNLQRFTDELGGQTYTNNIVIDWSTYNGTDVLGYINQTQTATNWNTAIDNCLAYSVGSYTSGWRLPNVLEIFNLYDFGNINGLGSYRLYRPPVFNLGVNRYWTSTIARFSNNVHTADSQYGEIRYTGITSSAAYFPCRNFTVNGTILT